MEKFPQPEKKKHKKGTAGMAKSPGLGALGGLIELATLGAIPSQTRRSGRRRKN